VRLLGPAMCVKYRHSLVHLTLNFFHKCNAILLQKITFPCKRYLHISRLQFYLSIPARTPITLYHFQKLNHFIS